MRRNPMGSADTPCNDCDVPKVVKTRISLSYCFFEECYQLLLDACCWEWSWRPGGNARVRQQRAPAPHMLQLAPPAASNVLITRLLRRLPDSIWLSGCGVLCYGCPLCGNFLAPSCCEVDCFLTWLFPARWFLRVCVFLPVSRGDCRRRSSPPLTFCVWVFCLSVGAPCVYAYCYPREQTLYVPFLYYYKPDLWVSCTWVHLPVL